MTETSNIILNKPAIEDALQEAFVATSEWYAMILLLAMELVIYEWPRPTLRRSGVEVDSPRDIIDTGALKESQVMVTKRFRTIYTYLVEYADIVYHGAFLTNGTEMPPRMWDRAAQQKWPVINRFAMETRKRL